MATTPSFQSFRDPALSLWQAAVHATLLVRQGNERRTSPAAGHETDATSQASASRAITSTAHHPLMQQAIRAIEGLRQVHAEQGVLPSQPGSFSQPRLSTDSDCAELAARIAWATFFHHSQLRALKNQWDYSSCDPFWYETLLEFERYVNTRDSRPEPYFVYTSLSDYVLSNCLPDHATVALISDWATGTNAALVLLQQLATFKPDVLIHLGDIYYAGLPSEDQHNFTALIAEVWPDNPPLVFTLDGNHDRYAGAAGGYYPLLRNLNAAAGVPQPNSYFALRNNFWQLLSMDTGYHDIDPFTVVTNLTYLEESEVDWHLDKIRNNGLGVDLSLNPAGVRGTVLLSHHQLFSFMGVGNNASGHPLAVNTRLVEAFAPALDQVDFWFWGHEHDLCIFEPYAASPGQPLPAGRCIGAGAVPAFTPRSSPPANLVLPEGAAGPPQMIDGTALGDNGVVFNHAYAIMTLHGPALSIDYYQFNSTDAVPGNPPPPPVPCYRESVPGPRAARQQ